MNVSVHKNRAMSRHSREIYCQRHDIEIQRCDVMIQRRDVRIQRCDVRIQRRNVPKSHLSQLRDVEIQRHDVPEHVEIQRRGVKANVVTLQRGLQNVVCQHRDVETQCRDVTEACVFYFFQRRDIGTLRRYREGQFQIFFVFYKIF